MLRYHDQGQQHATISPRRHSWESSAGVAPLISSRRASSAGQDLPMFVEKWYTFERPSWQAKRNHRHEFTIDFRSAYGDADKLMRTRRALEAAFRDVVPNNRDRITIKQFGICLRKPDFQSTLSDFGVAPHLAVHVFKLLSSHGKPSCNIHELISGLMEHASAFFESGREVDLKTLDRMREDRRLKAQLT
jgi:hypothetical protein